MCRWLMYHGDKIRMSDFSLTQRTLHSSQGAGLVNGDGFGIGVVYKLAQRTRSL